MSDKHTVIFHRDLILTEQSHRLGEDLPFSLLHDAALERFRGVSLLDLYRLLQDNGARIALGVTMWTVAPDTFTPLARAASWTYSP